MLLFQREVLNTVKSNAASFISEALLSSSDDDTLAHREAVCGAKRPNEGATFRFNKSAKNVKK